VSSSYETKKLGDICSVITRGISPIYIEEGGVCVLNQKCIRDHKISLADARRHDVSKKTVKEDRFIQLGDVLINSTGTGTLGRVAQVREQLNEKSTVDSHVTIVRPIKGKFHLEYFGYLIIRIEDDLKKSGEGASGQTELARTTISDKFLITYPISIEAQELIVAKLDSTLKSIESSIVNLKKNITNANEIFEGYKNLIFGASNPRWIKSSLKDLTTKIGSGATPLGGEKSYKKSGISFVRSMNVHDSGFRHEKIAFIDNTQASKLNNVTLEVNDVLLNITGASVARCCLVPSEILPARVNQHVSILRIRKNLIMPEFLHYALTSQIHKIELLATGEAGGSTRQAITKAQLEGYEVSFPSDIGEQLKIVEQIKRVKEATEILARAYNKKMLALLELKQSLLIEAFSGNL
jgi:type I restriction enzyme S subunit